MSKKTLHYGTETIPLSEDTDIGKMRSDIDLILGGGKHTSFLFVDARGYSQWLLVTPAIPLRLTERDETSRARSATVL
ncbi:hypothetical protein [Rathayibacter rathayi]|uniref:Uncharacterized protein n=1 Tax=Rathayibacter rathayi TaxID=33887 RepID=A0ABD6WBA1_RATRA|nr:hypothetical protein [Rathayibacter rathayi]AZZ48831.1 hypothetical protein C1O28_06175 [Rathayibacter rathayi]MWV73924.1 hypothetical protein [Rathayibacter rathayi NCPPB 2980 = VKM Ac-1601]PPF15386.1 hypothetical protein C5C04_03945 [Rathayibacter rathayi]PPF24800.1 hypothetical protein C5C34_04620 [Rathayibacter rathayi]PPF48831.1 hypothetical protein C5C08_08500 [Rathayibacter rathayi]